jgi:two-component system cell cycle sensor histidine kinase/response regulator CckA
MSTRGEPQRVTVLLATGDAALRAALARTLTGGGLGVTEAAGADEVIRRAAVERPQLVLLGEPLDSISPAEVGQRLRSDPSTAAIPVLLIPGAADPASAEGQPSAADLVAHVRALVRLHGAEEAARAARREAAEARSRLDAVLASSEDVIFSVDGEWVITQWNGAAERLLGRAAAEMLGQPLSPLVPPNYQRVLAAVKEALARGESIPPLGPLGVQHGGRCLELLARVAPLRDAEGAYAGAAVVIRDITERLRVEEALGESEERYRTLFERNPHPMFVYDNETLAYLAVNDAAVCQYGYTREEFLRMTIADVRPAEDVPALRLMLAASQPGFERRGVWRHRRKDGSLIDVEILAHGLPFGDRPACIVLAYDVSERRRMEEQFLQAQKMEAVGRLAGGVAHDFNNLLTVVNGYAAMLLEDLTDRPDSAGHARAILKAGERAAALTQQLLAFGRKQIVAARLLDLNAVVNGAAALIARIVGDDLGLALDLQPDLGRVRADPAQVEQVLLNLALNARDAMPHGGQLVISTRDARPDETGADASPGPQVVLTVADTGRGMTADVQRHLFEPFFTTKELGQGTGLGLATVYGIVTQAGGHITVETDPGEGTTFRVFLPRAADPAPPPAAPDPPAPPVARPTVLLADDEDGVRALAREVLVSAGYVVLEAPDGQAALRGAEGHPGRIDLLVSDVEMPGLGGRELAERLRARDPALRVLFLSGHTEDEVVRQGVSSAEVHFLPKPFSPTALAEKVRQVLGAAPGGSS